MELSDGLSEVQMVNLYMLLMLRESVLKNIVSACGRFGVADALNRADNRARSHRIGERVRRRPGRGRD